MNTLQRLHAEQDQSPWIDFIDRQLIESGRLRRAGRRRDPRPHQQPDHLRQGGRQRPVRRADPARDRGRRRQHGHLRGDRGRGRERRRGHPAPGLRRGRRGRWLRLDRGRAGPGRRHRGHAGARAASVAAGWRARTSFVKIPATPAGLPAIEDAIAEGININITLMFSVDVYRDVARAYIAGLRRRLERGEDVTRVASVASFFVSRVDTKVDKHARRDRDRCGPGAARARCHRQRQARLRGLRRDLRWRRVRRAARPPGRGSSAACGRAPRPRTPTTATCCTSRS